MLVEVRLSIIESILTSESLDGMGGRELGAGRWFSLNRGLDQNFHLTSDEIDRISALRQTDRQAPPTRTSRLRILVSLEGSRSTQGLAGEGREPLGDVSRDPEADSRKTGSGLVQSAHFIPSFSFLSSATPS